MALYEDPVAKAITDTIRTRNEDIKTYHHGDPLAIPKDYLPALIVEKDTTPITDLTNKEDEHVINVVLTIVTDIREDFLGSDTEGKDVLITPAVSQLWNILEGRGDSGVTKFFLKSTSIAGILRANRALGTGNRALDVSLRNPMTTNYGITVGKRGELTTAIEGNISFAVYFNQLRATLAS